MSRLTKKALAASMTALLEEKPLDKITVKEITDLCGVTRNTFYYHFQDVYDLLSWIFIDQTEELRSQYHESRQWKDGFYAGLNYLYDHKQMIYHVYRSINRENLERYLHQVVGIYALEFVEIQGQGTEVSREAVKITADFFQNAFVGSILQWVSEDMKTPPEQLAALCDGIFKGTIKDALITSQRILAEQRKNSLEDKSEK